MAERFEQQQKENKKRTKLIDFVDRKNAALTNQKVKSLINFDEDYSASIRSVAIEKNTKVNLTTRFLSGKMLMFSKVSIKSFVYDLIDIFMFPSQEIQEIYQKYQVEKCYLYQNLTDTDSTSVFFVFICDSNCSVSEEKARNTIFEVMLKSKVFDRLNLSAELYDLFNCRNEKLKKNVGLFEVENIDNANMITIALNPKEYYEQFVNYSDNKKHKGIKKLMPDMDFDSKSSCLSDLTEYFNDFLSTVNRIKNVE